MEVGWMKDGWTLIGSNLSPIQTLDLFCQFAAGLFVNNKLQGKNLSPNESNVTWNAEENISNDKLTNDALHSCLFDHLIIYLFDSESQDDLFTFRMKISRAGQSFGKSWTLLVW